MNRLLYPLSVLYGMLARLDRGLKQAHRLPKPVISVGNITWGGTGKTPLVIRTAREAVALGLKPAILTRGYFRKDRGDGTVTVSDGLRVLADPEVAGDEPLLLASGAPGSIVMVGADRRAAALEAIERFDPDCFILDDGFQHWRLARDLDVVCVNALNPFGNGMLIPAGILREPDRALARAHLVVITNAGVAGEERVAAIERRLAALGANATARAAYRVTGIRRLADGAVSGTSTLDGRDVIALSALGENAGFRSTLERSGVSVKEHVTFRDHHWYTPEELLRTADRLPGAPVVTTAKDAVRLKDSLAGFDRQIAERFYALDAELTFLTGEQKWQELVRSTLRFS